MKTIEIESFEAAKTYSDLLELVAQGHRVVIKQQGRRVAVLSRPDDAPEQYGNLSPDQILARFRALRKNVGTGRETIRSMVMEGR